MRGLCSLYLNGTDQEFSQVFTPTARTVSTAVLSCEVLQLEARIQQEIEEAQEGGQRDLVIGLNKALTGVQGLMPEDSSLTEDDVTDKKFQLEDRKRELAQDMHELTAGKRLDQARKEYQSEQSADDRLSYSKSESIARVKGVGLWQDRNPTPPWDFRRQR